jgi:hypothetical protein
MGDAVTILWAVTTEDGFSLVRAAGQKEGATVMAVSIGTLSICAVTAAHRGGVVAVMAGERDATFAYSAGVDVVVLVGAMTERSLASSIAEARERGRARIRRGGRDHQHLADVGEAMTLLRELLRCDVERPMIQASVECNGLHEEVQALFGVLGVLTEWAALVAPTSKLESVARALPGSAPGLLSGRLRRIQSSIQRAEQQLELLRDVCGLEPDPGFVNATTVTRLLWEPLARNLSPSILRVSVDDDCIVRVPRPIFMCMLLALVGHARQSLRESVDSPGTIELRVSPADQEATVVVEVSYIGEKEAPFGPDVFASGDYGTITVSSSLLSLRDRARHYGGELLLEEDEQGMTARLFLPTPAAELGPDDRSSIAPHDFMSRARLG